MLPCAIEYFIPPHNKLPFGKTVGLSGKQLHNLNAMRKGMPTYVWPTKPINEKSNLRAKFTRAFATKANNFAFAA